MSAITEELSSKRRSRSKMTETHVDTVRLHAVVAARVSDDALSWRRAAIQIGVSPSLLSRLKSGLRPDLEGYIRIVRWLGLSADDFITGRDLEPAKDAGLMTEITALLGKQLDLSEADKTYLQDLISSSLTHCRARAARAEQESETPRTGAHHEPQH